MTSHPSLLRNVLYWDRGSNHASMIVGCSDDNPVREHSLTEEWNVHLFVFTPDPRMVYDVRYDSRQEHDGTWSYPIIRLRSERE